jgi:hypothetical protein
VWGRSSRGEDRLRGRSGEWVRLRPRRENRRDSLRERPENADRRERLLSAVGVNSCAGLACCGSEGSPSETLFELLAKSRARDFDGRHWLIWFNGEFEAWDPSWFASCPHIERDAKTGRALAQSGNSCGF